MKKLLILAILMLALVITAVACQPTPDEPDTSADDVTTVETPTEDPNTPETPAPETEPETPAPDTDEPETPAPDTDEPETPKPEVPTDEPETDPPVDPADPVWIMNADDLANMANTATSTVEKTEEGFASFTATGGDPWFLLCGNIGEMPEYMVIRYRTNTSQSGEFFIGNGANPEGGKSFVFNYENSGEWNLMIFHLPTVAPYMTERTVGHIRYDFYTGGPDEGFLEVAYIGFFNTAEYALAYDFEQYPPYIEADDPAAGKVAHSFDTFYVNGGMYFPEDGGAGDKLTAQDNTIVFGEGETHNSMVLRGWIGFNQPMASFGYYIDNYKFVYGDFFKATEDGVKAAGGEHASRFEILVPLDELTGGTHKVGFIVKLEDGTVVRLREDLKVIIVPETTDDIINLATGHGAPFSGAPNNYFGQRYNIGEAILKKVSIADMATYADGGTNTWEFKVWQWNTDYETTVAGTPLFTAAGENHPDNSTFSVDIPTDKFITGDIYYEVTYLSGSGCFTGWTADTVAEGLETYVAGQLKEGAYSANLTVGTPVTEEEVPEVIPDHQLQNPPVYIIKAKDMMITNANQMKYEKEDGYVHFIPTGGDPNFLLFNNQTGSRYAVVKYRTEYQANIQIFLGSEGSGPKDDTTMLEQAVIPDGQWHLAIFDTQTLVDRGVYDGTTAAFLRLDVMESGYVLDENGQPSKDESGAWLKLPLPEGATIDIAYFAFFETEEKINKFEYAPVVTDKTVYNVGEPIMITATGADKDWVGIAAADAAETLRWWYVADVGEGVAINALDNTAIQAGTGDATGNLPAGDYYVVWVPNDQSMHGAQGLCRYPITIVDPNADPEEPVVPEGPAVENYLVPQSQWVITGHNTQLNDTTNPMVAAGGVESAALLHQGSIALGNIDLSKYSKVVVMWGCDNSQVTIDHYNANANNRIMLLNAEMSMVMSPAEGSIIAGGTYELKGWKVTAFEIDLTGIDYNGPVWLAIDALPGTFALVASVEFIA